MLLPLEGHPQEHCIEFSFGDYFILIYVQAIQEGIACGSKLYFNAVR